MINLIPRVYICSPYRTNTQRSTFDNYLIQCLDDSIKRGEAPYAPHAYLPRTKSCNDSVKECRELGISIGNKFLLVCNQIAVYRDFGISEGMQAEMDFAKANKIRIELRRIL